MSEEQYFPEYRIYKPNGAGNGSASKLQLRVKFQKYRDVYMFWVATQQIGMKDGNAAFAWNDNSKTITVKMEPQDLGEFLAVINGEKKAAGQTGKFQGIFHKTNTYNTSIQFSRLYDKTDPKLCTGFWLRIARKDSHGKLLEVKHSITHGEAQILKVLLTDAVSCFFNWKQRDTETVQRAKIEKENAPTSQGEEGAVNKF